VLAAACVALAIGAGVAWATGLTSWVNPDGTLTFCVQKNAGNVRLAQPGAQCKTAAEDSVVVNQQGVQGEKGDTGEKGDVGDPGRSLTATPLAAGDVNCDSRGGVAISPEDDLANVLGYVCNGAGGAQGPPGQPGEAGADGAPGGNLVGSACTLPSGTAGTVQMSVGATGAISFVCQTTGGGGPNLCPETLPTYPNMATSCDSNTGTLSYTCVAGFANADGDITNGCEVTLSSAPEICNGIDDDGDGVIDDNTTDSGPRPNGLASCVNGHLSLTCNSGWADGNGNVADGCEINVLNDSANCGSVGNAIPPSGSMHALWACFNGQAVIMSCLAGWADLNGSPIDGCEAPAGGLPVSWANLQFPTTLNVPVGISTPPVYGRVFVAGATDTTSSPIPWLQAEVGFGPAASSPDFNPAWTWTTAGFNINIGNADEYAAALTVFAPGVYDYVYRFSTDGGLTWVYGELDGPHSIGTYDWTQAGHLTVT